MKKRFSITYHFIDFTEISFGINIALSNPCIEIHLPFGFITIGWSEDEEKLFGFTSKKIINNRNLRNKYE